MAVVGATALPIVNRFEGANEWQKPILPPGIPRQLPPKSSLGFIARLVCGVITQRMDYLGRTQEEAVGRYKQYSERISRGLKIPDLNDDQDGFDLLSVADLCNLFLGAQEK